jgi:hypothetical protein
MMSETFRIGVTAFASMAVFLRILAAAYRTHLVCGRSRAAHSSPDGPYIPGTGTSLSRR